MTSAELLSELEPLMLSAVYVDRVTIRNVIERLEAGEQVGLGVVLDVLDWHATRGFRSEREAFAIAAERLRERAG